MKENYTKLYQKGAFGINIWEIWNESSIIYMFANSQTYTEEVTEGKQGRSIAEQVKLRIEARIRNKLDNGFEKIPEFGNYKTNQLGLPLPMLATPLKDVKHKINVYDCYYQPKLNGHRCLVIKKDGKLIAYSRRGKYITTINDILETIDIPEGLVLDGELYCHGVPLQAVASWAKRKQPNTALLSFNIYDSFIPNDKSFFKNRYKWLQDQNFWGPRVKLVTTRKLLETDSLKTIFNRARDFKFEGLILRPEDSTYQIGDRNLNLIKVKERYDSEFRCIDIIPSREGWGILILQADNGLTFKTNAPGTYEQKRKALVYKHEYIGKLVTCEYAELTDSGIPFHCVAMNWRNDI